MNGTNPSLRLLIEWWNGSRLPVRLSPSATGYDLLCLLRFSFDEDTECLLMNGDQQIKLHLDLASQHITQDQVIHVFCISKMHAHQDADAMPSNMEINVLEDVYNEILRINDVRFNALEGRPQGEMIMNNFLQEQIESDDTRNDSNRLTICDASARCIVNEPLPALPRRDDNCAWNW